MPVEVEAEAEARKPSFSAQQNVQMPELPAALDFAGEKIPLENFDTRESLERELMVNMFWHSQMLLIIKQTSRFFPVIEIILKSNGIPDDFKYLCVAESGLQQVTSPAKAVGIWQLIPATGKELGLEISDEVDERYHIEKSTLAACKYLQKSHSLFGSWTLAAAAYNMGINGLMKQIERQKSVSYHDLRLNDETSRYIFRILAFKLIISNPQKYGFYIPLNEMYPPYRYKEVAVSTPIPSWADFAIQHNTNYKILKLLNPWLRDAMLTNKHRRTYYIKVPEAGFREKAYGKK
ncbi:MAG: lytic transglycosylase domain-containing protein [Prevotellaceae bacterium]|nr:lytic transglycosylase domain-containing protein [Prevotellaceae bacterium]